MLTLTLLRPAEIPGALLSALERAASFTTSLNDAEEHLRLRAARSAVVFVARQGDEVRLYCHFHRRILATISYDPDESS